MAKLIDCTRYIIEQQKRQDKRLTDFVNSLLVVPRHKLNDPTGHGDMHGNGVYEVTPSGTIISSTHPKDPTIPNMHAKAKAAGNMLVRVNDDVIDEMAEKPVKPIRRKTLAQIKGHKKISIKAQQRHGKLPDKFPEPEDAEPLNGHPHVRADPAAGQPLVDDEKPLDKKLGNAAEVRQRVAKVGPANYKDRLIIQRNPGAPPAAVKGMSSAAAKFLEKRKRDRLLPGKKK